MRPCLAPLLFLAACAGLDPATALRMSQIDPLTADPAGFAIRLDLPAGVGIASDSAALGLSATRNAETRGGVFRIVAAPSGDIWRIAPVALTPLREAQEIIAEWERVDPDGTEGSLTISATPCRAGDGPAHDATLSAALQVAPGGPYLPILREVPVADLMRAAGLVDLPPCA